MNDPLDPYRAKRLPTREYLIIVVVVALLAVLVYFLLAG